MLKDLTVCRKIYEQPNTELRERGLAYQERLIGALCERDAESAEMIIREHMLAARQLMLEQEAELMRGFLRS